MKNSRLILFAIFIALSTATTKPQTVVFIKYGECYKAINHLNESVKNDSIAVSLFWENYDVINKNIDFLKTKTPSKVIEFFNLEENKKLMCENKRFKGSKVLLGDSNNNKQEQP